MSWKDKRIKAINYIIKKNKMLADDGNPYYSEWRNIIKSKAESKKEYKKEKKIN